jgi:hypothetical protein
MLVFEAEQVLDRRFAVKHYRKNAAYYGCIYSDVLVCETSCDNSSRSFSVLDRKRVRDRPQFGERRKMVRRRQTGQRVTERMNG